MFKHFTKSQSTLFASLSLSISLCWFSPTYTLVCIMCDRRFFPLIAYYNGCASLDMPIVEINRLFFFLHSISTRIHTNTEAIREYRKWSVAWQYVVKSKQSVTF